MIEGVRGTGQSGLDVVPGAMRFDMSSTMTFETFHPPNSCAVRSAMFPFVTEDTTGVDDVVNARSDFHHFVVVVVRGCGRSIFGQCRWSRRCG